MLMALNVGKAAGVVGLVVSAHTHGYASHTHTHARACTAHGTECRQGSGCSGPCGEHMRTHIHTHTRTQHVNNVSAAKLSWGPQRASLHACPD